jgi:hypothetical protein
MRLWRGRSGRRYLGHLVWVFGVWPGFYLDRLYTSENVRDSLCSPGWSAVSLREYNSLKKAKACAGACTESCGFAGTWYKIKQRPLRTKTRIHDGEDTLHMGHRGLHAGVPHRRAADQDAGQDKGAAGGPSTIMMLRSRFLYFSNHQRRSAGAGMRARTGRARSSCGATTR